MAIQVEYRLPFAVTLPRAYVRVTRVMVDQEFKMGQVVVKIHADDAARKGNIRPAFEKTIEIEGADYDTLIACIGKTNDPIQAGYAFIKKLDAFSKGQDV